MCEFVVIHFKCTYTYTNAEPPKKKISKNNNQLFFVNRFNRSPKVQSASRHGNHKKWDSRNVNLNSNGILNNNYSRGIRKPHSDQQDANDITDEHFNENGLTKYARDADDSDKCQDNVNGTNSTQLKYDRTHHNRSLQLNKFNEG